MNRIRELREDRDLRQSDVSSATGIDQRTLSNYETGRTNPDSYAIIKLANFFDVTTDYLLGVSKYSFTKPNQILSQIENIQTMLNELYNSINNEIKSSR